jgi:hypothetical protein
MFTVFGQSKSAYCDGLSRRDFLRAGSLAIGGLSLPWLLNLRAKAAAANADYAKDAAVVVIFLGGGASHIETFNPNLDGPDYSRSITGEVKSTLPGVTFGGTFPELAKLAQHAVVVRSFKHPIGNHEQAISHVLTAGTDPDGKAKEGQSIGSMFARIRGSNHPLTGLPTYALLTDPHKDPQYSREMNRVVVGSRAGPLGATCEPFIPTGGGPAVANMKLNVPTDRLHDRVALLKAIEEVSLAADELGDGLSPPVRQAVDLLTRGGGEAFDISREPKAIRERYDTTSFKTGKKLFEPCRLGEYLLAARRLVEAGCGFVTVQSAGWDMHADGNNPNMADGMNMLGPPLDKALSAFITDLHDRGLLKKTLIVVTGDFGRTPKINNRGGRDHWSNLCTLALFGGSLRTGQVIGKSSHDNGIPATEPMTTNHLLATVMHHLFDLGLVRVARGLPTALQNLLSNIEPIPGVY